MKVDHIQNVNRHMSPETCNVLTVQTLMSYFKELRDSVLSYLHGQGQNNL